MASSKAASIQAMAAASAAGSADLTTTSTSLPSGRKLGYEPTETPGGAPSSASSTPAIRLSVVRYDPPPAADRLAGAQLVGERLEHRLHLGRQAGQHVDVPDREARRAAERVLQRAASLGQLRPAVT